MLVRPKRKRNRRQVVYHRHRMPILREVDRSNKKLARLASLHTNMRKLLRHINRKLFLFFFTASRTKNPPKLPLISAKRADEAALSSIAFDPQHSEQRPAAAQRTNPRRSQHRRYRRPPRNKRGVRLQKCSRKKLRKRPNLLIEAPPNFPVRRQECHPRIGRHCRNFSSRRGESVRSVLFNERKKIAKMRKQE